MGSRQQQTQWFYGPDNGGQRRQRQRPPPSRRPRQPPLHVLVAEAVRQELQPLRQELAELRREVASLRNQRAPVASSRPRRPLKKQLKVFSSPSTLHLNEYFEITKLANKGELQLPASPCLLTHVQGDLLASSNDKVFMHAVAADLKMSRGFAAKVKRKFPVPSTDLPPARLLQPGHVVTQHDTETNTTIMHVITKFRSQHKIWQNPNQFLSNYLQGLRGALETCKNSRITHLAMPRMGCNLDQLDWRYVEFKIHQICEELKFDFVLNITVYTLGRQRRTSSSQQGTPNPATVHTPAPTQEKQTGAEPKVPAEVTEGEPAVELEVAGRELSPAATTAETGGDEEHPREVIEEAQLLIERVEAGELVAATISPTHTPSKISRIVPKAAPHTDHVYSRQDTNFSPGSARRSLQMQPDAAAPTIIPTGSKRNL
jgi:hypothetical protein